MDTDVDSDIEDIKQLDLALAKAEQVRIKTNYILNDFKELVNGYIFI